MSRYQLRSGGTTLVDVPSSSNLDGSGRKETRRGTFIRTLSTISVQYKEAPALGDAFIQWDVPRADGSQRGILQSAANGYFGDELVLRTPVYGDIQVAFLPGGDGYEEEKLIPDFGFRVRTRLARLA